MYLNLGKGRKLSNTFLSVEIDLFLPAGETQV